ncbi:hypothetical protein ACQP2P_33360 [Dactylosporangium sp. CA-139114]
MRSLAGRVCAARRTALRVAWARLMTVIATTCCLFTQTTTGAIA